MKSQILKIAKVKNEKEFYAKYPTEEAFMKAHGEAFEKAKSGIHIKESKKGTFTAAAKKHGKSVQGFASQVLSNKDNYSPAMVKKANFAKNASKWKKGQFGENLISSGLPSLQDQTQKFFDNQALQLQGRAPQAMAQAQEHLAGLTKPSGMMDKLGGPMGMLNTGLDLAQGIGMLKEEKKNKQQAKTFKNVSNVVKQAAGLPVDKPKRKYVRPEDALLEPNSVAPSYGTGTNFLQLKKGGEIQNTYAPNTLYTDLEEYQFGGQQAGSLGSSLGSWMTGGKGQQTGAGKIGSTVGGVAGTFFGPAGTLVGSAIGGLIGGAIGGAGAKKTAQNMEAGYDNLSEAAFMQGSKNIHNQYSAFVKDGGEIPNPQIIKKFGDYNLSELLKSDPMMDTLRTGGNIRHNAMDGELKSHWGGYPEPVSYNPYLPDSGESVLFKGQSHDDGGIGVSFGNNPVEVEGGEPAVKLQDGGGASNLTVFGNMKIPSYGVSEIGDENAKGKKFKTYINDLNKKENTQNKISEKGLKLINDTNVNSAYDKLTVSSGKALFEGSNMKMKDIANKKQTAAGVQKAILDTAEQFGLKSDELAKGKIKKEKRSKNIAQDGKNDMPPGSFLDENSKLIQWIRDFQTMPTKKENVSNKGESQATADLIKKIPTVLGTGQYPQKQYPFPIKSITKSPIDSYELEGHKSNNEIPLYQRTNFTSNFGANQYGHYEWPTDEVGIGIGKNNTTKVPRKIGGGGKKAVKEDSLKMRMIDAPQETPFSVSMSTIDPEGSTPVDLTQYQASDTPQTTGKTKRGFNMGEDWMNVLNSALPYLRPSNQKPLDPNQLSGEMFALASNQLDPVQAQLYQPLLEQATDISYQDTLNANQADFNAMKKAVGNNPAALAQLAAQKYGANSQVLGQQFRENQANKLGTYNRNRGVLNDATLKNLSILDTQYQRQATAKSNTKAVAQNALTSIADKIAQNKLENRTLGVYENLYNYRFGPQGRAWNMNPLVDFQGMIENASPQLLDKDGNIVTTTETRNSFDGMGRPKGKEVRHRTTTKGKANGGIVKAMKKF